MLAALLHRDDARRATEVIEALLAHGFRGALTGGLAIDAQLRTRGRPVAPRRLNDLDFVVQGFAAIPHALAGAFLQHHVHPDATSGRTLVQLIDETRRLRVDLFGELGATLSRAHLLDSETGALPVVSLEDLVARTTAFVAGHLARGGTIDAKHATAFRRLHGLGHPAKLADAWRDHRQTVPGTLDDAAREAARLLDAHPELVIVEEHATNREPCPRCCEQGPFRPAPIGRIVEILGYA